jgi:hypothetical protein
MFEFYEYWKKLIYIQNSKKYVNNEMCDILDKKKYGQFFTTNYKYILQNLKIPDEVFHNKLTIVEPFAGNGDLLNFIKSTRPYENIKCYDIDPKQDYIIKRDTLKNPPNYTDTYILTNPPYLARNKCPDKELFTHYDCNDLYKCFIKEISGTNRCRGGIVIIPLNFFSSIRKSDIHLRKNFLNTYSITHLNIFEERVFSDTSYTICSFSFIEKISTQNSDKIQVSIYPSKKNLTIELNENNNYIIGGEIYYLPCENNIKITRLTSKNKEEKNTNILVKCIDDNEQNKIKLSYVSDRELYIDKTPNLSSRTYATLIVYPPLSEFQQKELVREFNSFLYHYRETYHSLFLTNYRESKDIARKRISFDLVYDICKYLLNHKNIYKQDEYVELIFED